MMMMMTGVFVDIRCREETEEINGGGRGVGYSSGNVYQETWL